MTVMLLAGLTWPDATADRHGRHPLSSVRSNAGLLASDTQRPRRNWIHLDLYTDDQKAEVGRLEALGARRYPWRYRTGADFVVLEDPDGNLFCVVQKD